MKNKTREGREKSTITSDFKKAVSDYRLFKKHERMVIGVSGGPDSMALLLLLDSLKKTHGLSLCIAHLDHGLRKGSRADAQFVKDFGARLRIPVFSRRINLKKKAPKGSIEEAARQARFDFFFEVASGFKARTIALGHNRDDQAETVLMRILRGTGLSGLSGISPKRKIGEFVVIRPMLKISRMKINGYLKLKRITACTDETNSEDRYFRNKIRLSLLPLLENSYNRNIKDLLCGMAQSVSNDYDFLELAARKEIRLIRNRIKLVKIKKMHSSLQRIILRRMIAFVQGDTRRITFRHIQEIEDLIFNRPIGSIVNLPCGLRAYKKKEFLVFSRTLSA